MDLLWGQGWSMLSRKSWEAKEKNAAMIKAVTLGDKCFNELLNSLYRKTLTRGSITGWVGTIKQVWVSLGMFLRNEWVEDDTDVMWQQCHVTAMSRDTDVTDRIWCIDSVPLKLKSVTRIMLTLQEEHSPVMIHCNYIDSWSSNNARHSNLCSVCFHCLSDASD